MSRMKVLSNEDVDGKVRGVFDGVQKKLGTVPNLMRTMANSPAVLDAYLGFSGTLAKGSLPAKLREQISLAVGEANRCDYCVAAHAALGKLAGLNDEEVIASRRGESQDSKTAAALAFAQKVVRQRGLVGDDDVESVRAAGYSDGDIAEIVANVALNLFTNYFNHVAETPVDFPQQQALAHAAA